MFHQAEAVGEHFDIEKFRHAQRTGWQVLEAVAKESHAGDTVEAIANRFKAEVAKRGLAKSWHPPQIRLGKNTLCAFGQPPIVEAPLQATDIFFLDFGVIVDGYESDCGRTFVLGDDAEMQRCAGDAKRVYQEGIAHWEKTRCSGLALYEWTRQRATELGWKLSEESADGHRLSDFPHHRFSRGSLIECDFSVAPDRWVYEVHLHDRAGKFGAFYEDLLSPLNL